MLFNFFSFRNIFKIMLIKVFFLFLCFNFHLQEFLLSVHWICFAYLQYSFFSQILFTSLFTFSDFKFFTLSYLPFLRHYLLCFCSQIYSLVFISEIILLFFKHIS